MKMIRRMEMARRDFWAHVFDSDGSGPHRVTLPVLAFGLYSLVIWLIDRLTPADFSLGMQVAPYEFAGAILGSLLVLRTNSGLERWWEGRKLWGSITNESRNLGILVLANGPADVRWRREIIGWIAAFGHVCRRRLRNQRTLTELVDLIGPEDAETISRAEHMPTAVSLRIAELLREARDRGVFDPFAYVRAEEQRSLLIDYLGGCERILKTPLAAAYVVLIRRFIVLFLITLPCALLRRVEWQTPLVTMLVAYPILALDHIADDLQHPFSTRSINHLPLNDITTTIEANLLALVPEPEPASDGQAEARLTGAKADG